MASFDSDSIGALILPSGLQGEPPAIRLMMREWLGLFGQGHLMQQPPVAAGGRKYDDTVNDNNNNNNIAEPPRSTN